MPNENERKDGTGGDEQGSSMQQGQHRSWHEHRVGDSRIEHGASAGHEAHAQSEERGEGGGGSAGGSGGGSNRPKQRRGFAAMDPAKQKEIASKGGKASHALGTGHEWTSESAREAGRKGGQASRGGRGKLPSGGSEGGTPAE